MHDHAKIRGIEESALLRSPKDTSALSLQPEHLCFFMEQKVSLMTRYLSITKSIKETLMLKNEINLLKFLSKRQDCINMIQKTDLSIQKLMNAGADELSRITDELKSSLDGYLQGIKSLLEQIAPIDAEVMVMVEEESRDIKAELLKISNGRHGAKSYGNRGTYNPRYLDAKR
ncbi:MAG: hypothetical protein EHM85_03035 [Desulfobacteraceae bacterium]|nr:MAG: hypothetical protein EHM85_03035 [Desulfobacteraceae bacterium]